MDKNLRENSLNFLKQTLADMLVESKNEQLNENRYVVCSYSNEFYIDVVDNGEAGKTFVAKCGKPNTYTEDEARAIVEEIGEKRFDYNTICAHTYGSYLYYQIDRLTKAIDFLTSWTAQ